VLPRVSGLCEKLIILGGINSQNLSEAGAEANLDVQFAFGVSHPIPVRSSFHSLPFRRSFWRATFVREHFTRLLDGLLSLNPIRGHQQIQTSKTPFLPECLPSYTFSFEALFGLAWLYCRTGEPTPYYIHKLWWRWTDRSVPRRTLFAIKCNSWNALVPKDFAKRICAGFAQLGARGVSLMFSSGDFGVGDGNSDPTTQKCFTNDERNITRFIPTFPAT